MNIDEVLSGLKREAKKDRGLLLALLETRRDPHPVAAFCALGTQAGFPIDEMDLISYGEDAYAAMRRSTNGGGENSPLLSGEDDYYELFMAELEQMR